MVDVKEFKKIMPNELPNNARNLEAAMALAQAKNAELGVQSEKKTGIANALSSLDMAESLQFLQLQLKESSEENRIALEGAIGKLIQSNEHLSESNKSNIVAMKWLTGALVVVGVIQIIVSWIAVSK